MLKKYLVLVLFLGYLSPLFAGQLLENNGNIFYSTKQGKQQLTNLGIDSQPALSPDGKRLAFIRTPTNQLSELWIMDISTHHAHPLVLGHEGQDMQKNLTELNNPLFSLNNRFIYFLSAAWATSNAVHVFDLKTGKQRFLTDGNSVDVVRNGKYRGYLLVSKHKYYPNGGSYEENWLVSPQGHPLKPFNQP